MEHYRPTSDWQNRPDPQRRALIEPRLSLVTLGVADVERSRRFYEAGLGWKASGASVASTAFFQLGPIVLSLYGRAALAEDSGLTDAAPTGFGGISLAHNVRSRAEVDSVLARAAAAGARITKPAGDAAWGGYTGTFTDPDGHPWEVAWNPHFRLHEDGALELPR
jgi:catechol 2,3-dioxygenase-like lactoylglutathione lyase family enzyme